MTTEPIVGVVADGTDCPWTRVMPYMLSRVSIYGMTLWEAYRTANRRRAAITTHLAPEQGLGNGRTERSLRVRARLVNGHVAVQQGASSDWTFVPVEKAKTITVER